MNHWHKCSRWNKLGLSCPFAPDEEEHFEIEDPDEEEPPTDEPDFLPPARIPVALPVLPPFVMTPGIEKVIDKKSSEVLTVEAVERFLEEPPPVKTFPKPPIPEPLPPEPVKRFEKAAKVAQEVGMETAVLDPPPPGKQGVDFMEASDFEMKQVAGMVEEVVAQTFSGKGFGKMDLPPSPWPSELPAPSLDVPGTGKAFYYGKGFGGSFFEALFEGIGDLFPNQVP